MENPHNNSPNVYNDLLSRANTISNEVETLKADIAAAENKADAYVSDTKLECSQQNNETSQDLTESEQRFGADIEVLKSELVEEKSQAKLHHDTGAAAAAHLVGLPFTQTTTPEDVDRATEHLTDEQASEKARLPYGPRLFVGGWNAGQIILMVACAAMSGTTFAILFHALDPTDLLAQPLGLFVAVVAGTVVALSANKLMRAWIEFGALVAKRTTTQAKFMVLAAMTGGIAIGLALADASCIIRINEVRARLDPSLGISPLAAFGVGMTLSALYVLASAQTYKAKGYNDTARALIDNEKAAFDKEQREKPEFRIYSTTVKEALTGYKRALERITALERKIEELIGNRQSMRDHFRQKRKRASGDRRSDDAKLIDVLKLKLRDAENRLAHVQALLSRFDDENGGVAA